MTFMVKEGSWREFLIQTILGVVILVMLVLVFVVPFGECDVRTQPLNEIESATTIDVTVIDLENSKCNNNDTDSFRAAKVSNMMMIITCGTVVLSNVVYFFWNVKPVRWVVRCSPFAFIPFSGLEIGSFIWARNNYQRISDKPLGSSIYIAIVVSCLSFLLSIYTAVLLAFCLRPKSVVTTATVNFKSEYLARKFSEPLVSVPLAS